MSESAAPRDYTECLDLLRQRLGEPPPGRIQLLTGPRQVGKTTLLLELARELGEGAVYEAGDAPEAALPGAGGAAGGGCGAGWVVGAWAMEVKTGPFGLAELRGLMEFVRRYPRYRPLVVCDDAGVATAVRAGVEAIPWRDFLLAGTPGGARPPGPPGIFLTRGAGPRFGDSDSSPNARAQAGRRRGLQAARHGTCFQRGGDRGRGVAGHSGVWCPRPARCSLACGVPGREESGGLDGRMVHGTADSS